MSWATSPTTNKKHQSTTSTSQQGGSAPDGVDTSISVEEEVIVPIVLWDGVPQVEVSCLHVLYLPMSQPSQNSSTPHRRRSTSSSGLARIPASTSASKRGSVTNTGLPLTLSDDDDSDGDQDEAETYQVCVFAGTIDSAIFYWLFEQDTVVQVNMLLFESSSGSRGPSPVQSIVSGIDEWGQSMLISITLDGAIARWQLPNGHCSYGNASLAKQLAPIKGMEMFCNNHYAMVYSQESRMMVLDTLKMALLYCMDTAQEQVRRSIAVGELKVPTFRFSTGQSVGGKQNGGIGNSTRTVDSQGDSSSSLLVPMQSGINSNTFNTSKSSLAMSNGTFVWDSLVLSLGSEGLVKCFLWAKPRNGTGVPSFTSNGSGPSLFSGFQWIQESCWVISWADDADDVTCSQSTSLKDVDNMNPQTALMRSIKESYFPSALHVSPDSSLVLFIWKTKWVVLKRKWLCKIGTPGQPSKSKTSVRVGSCRIPPSSFLWRSTSAVNESCSPDVFWENGAFLTDNQLVLWTNTGHVFQFPTCGSSMTSGGKLFIFTKDQDQFVPRSNHKNLAVIEHGNFVAFMNQCECCASKTEHKTASLHPWQTNSTIAGFTTRVMPLSTPGYAKSPSFASFSFRLFHMCKRGSFGCWTLSLSQYSSPPSMPKSSAFPVHKYDRVKFHSLSEGYGRNIQSSKREDEFQSEPRREVCVSHILLGRDTGSSSAYDRSTNRVYRRRKRREAWHRLPGSIMKPSLSGFAAPSTTTSVEANDLPTALGPIVLRPPPPITSTIPTRAIGDNSVSVESMSRHLMDVPLFAKGFCDGDVEFGLLGNMQMPFTEANNDADIRITCHRGKVTAIAHCSWVPASYLNDSSPSFSMLQAITSGMRKGKSSKTTNTVDESCLAMDKNPFYRSRIQPTAFQKRSHSSRHMSITGGGPMNFNIPLSVSAPSSPKQRTSSSAKSGISSANVHFMVFTGGQDGVLKIIELTLRPFDTSFRCEAIILQQFRKHRGAIKDISISPPTRDSNSKTFPERFVATIGIDNKVTIYAPLYSQNPNGRGSFANSSSKGHCGIEWECILELCDHSDVICGLDWHLERGLLYIECEDRMLHVWNMDTGILERSLPSALIFDGGNPVQDGDMGQSRSKLSVDCDSFAIGGFALHLLNYNVMKSAEYIKQSWRIYFYALTTIGNSSLDNSETVSPASPYAIGSIELLLLSFLLSWGATSEVDRACHELLGLNTPQMLYSCALRDPISGALTVPLPWKSAEVQTPRSLMSTPRSRPNSFVRNWQHSSALSATLALGIISLSMNLMEHKYSKMNSRGITIDDDKGRISALILPSSPRNKEEFHVLWSQLITQHSVVLPDYVPLFREPALEFLARFGFHSCDYTQLAARTLLSGVIKRLEPTLRSTLTAEYSTKLHCELVRLEMETGCKFNGSAISGGIDFSLVVSRLGSLVILLSMIGTCYPGEISPAGAREVCDILVFLLKANAQFVASVSAELLTKGLMLFRPHLVDLSSLICQLLMIDLREKQRNPNNDGSPQFGSNARVLANGGSNAALSLLVELGACESAFVLTLLQQEMHNTERSHAFRECVLLYLTELINAHYLLMYRHLPAVVDTIMCCLDPTKPERRKRCLELSTRCLHNLVRRFPMVDFHKETQRLAIGTMEAVIFIYDLRTATKWRVLDGHTAAISAVAFRQNDGHMLVSYAAREGSVRWWNSGNAGLFGGMLKMQQSCLKEHKLEVLKSIANAPSSSGGASADLKQVIQTCRFQFLTLTEKPAEQKGKKVLRLTREDASQVQFLL